MRRTTIDKEIMGEREELKRSKKERKKGGKFKKFLIFIFILGTIGCYTGLFLLYGPYAGFRDWLITTAMTTMNHQYFATWFYDDATINDCLNKNKIVEVSDNADTDLIEIVDYSKNDSTPVTYENEYERQILEKSSNNNDYKIIEIEGNKYTGYLVAIYDPSRVTVATSNQLGKSGQYLTSISEQSKSYIGINAGGFKDDSGEGNGGSPNGITVSGGKYLSTNALGQYNVIGFNKDNKLVMGKYSVKQCQSEGIRDAVTFGPVLIKNGQASQIQGNGGGGNAPRSAIGQRADGIVLFLVLDGSRTLRKRCYI